MTTTTKTALLTEVEGMIRAFAFRLARTAGGSVEAADLAQVGRIAALKCAETFAENGGAAFRTYCYHPVGEEMKREACRSRSAAQRSTGKNIARDISFSAPVGSEESEQTVGDLFVDPAPLPEAQVTALRFEARVRAIVARVREEQSNQVLFDDLLERLMTSHFAGAGERMRSEVPLAVLAQKHGMTRQGIALNEKRVLAVLTVALEGVES